jgi:cysteinyl-tRNA synthetase
MTSVLGIDPQEQPWAGQGETGAVEDALRGLVEDLLAERGRARHSGDFTRADEIRERLRQVGVAVEDTAEGPRWNVGS